MTRRQQCLNKDSLSTPGGNLIIVYKKEVNLDLMVFLYDSNSERSTLYC